MAKKTLIIEIGEHITKVSVGSKRGRSFHSIRNFLFTTPENTVSDGLITAGDILASTLKEQIASNRATDAQDVIYVLSSSKIVSREVTLPPVKANKIGDLIATNSKDYFPIDISGYQISHKLIETISGDNPGCRVLVTAAPKNIMTSYQKITDILGLNLIAFDHVANSQLQVFNSLQISGITLYIDISTNYTLTTYLSDGMLLMQRSMPFGALDVIDAAMNRAGLAALELDTAINNATEAEWINKNLPYEEYTQAASRLTALIERSVDFFKSIYKGEAIDRIVILGSCSSIAGLKKVINSAIKVDTFSIDEIQGINKVIEGQHAAMFATTMSAAIDPLSLIPSDMSQTKFVSGKSKSSNLKYAVGLLVVSILVGGTFAMMSLVQLYFVSTELDDMNARMRELQPVLETYNQYSQIIVLENDIKLLDHESIGNNANLRAFLEELEQKMPANLLMLSASCDANGISMNVEVANMEDAAVAIAQLRTFESIQNILVSPISESGNDVGLPIVSFSLSCMYKATEAQLTEVPTPIVQAEQPIL